jgi:diguanylate cyclase (GGDEF)-like protein
VLLDGVTYINTIDDVDADPEARDLLISLHKYSSASVPIFIHGRLWGQLWFSTVVGEPPFTVGDIEVLMAVAGLMSGVIAQSEQLDRVARQAFQDPLTGIANRRAIDDDLRQLSEGRMSTAIALIDVDLLKETNDNQGHEAGDAALVAVAASLSRLTARLHSAVVGRLGGDEFALIVPDTDGAPQQTEMIEADLRQVRSDLLARGMPSVSYGVAYVRGNWSPREALSQADKRLYAAKRASKRAARRDPQPQLPGEVDA